MNSPRLPDGLWPVVRDGVRSRVLLSGGTLLLTVLAVASAVLGPSFATAVTNSLVVTRLAEARPQLTGLSWEYQTAVPAEEDTSSTGEQSSDYETVMQQAVVAVAAVKPSTHLPAQFQYETVYLNVPDIATDDTTRRPPLEGVDVKLLAKDGACDRLRVTGNCPTSPGEILMLAGDAQTDGLQIGDTIRLGETLNNLKLVGTYLPPDVSQRDSADYWFDLTRFQSLPYIIKDRIGVRIPRRPAPYVTVPETFARVPTESLLIRADSKLNVTPNLRADDFPALLRAIDSNTTDQNNPTSGLTQPNQSSPPQSTDPPTGTLTEVSLNDLESLTAEIAAERKVASSSVAPAVLSVILVALALMARLLTAAADLRLPEIALASLRGAGTRRTWTLALAEPITLLAIAAPIGFAVGVASSWLLARLWLVPGLPLPLPWMSWVAGGLVIALTALVAVLATRNTLRRTLAMMLAGIKRPDRSPRAVKVGTYAVIALAVIIPLSAITGGRTAPDATDLILPVLLGVAAGIVAIRVTLLAATWAQKRRRGSIAAYVSVRALARRQEATLVIVPLAVAVAVSLFAAGIYGAAASWRTSVAATEAPANYVYNTDQTMTAAIDLTHDIDPDGRWLMAAATFNTSEVPWTVVDAPRLARVATWSDQWTEQSPTNLAQQLSAAPLPIIRGKQVSLTVTALDSAATPAVPLTVELVLRPFNDNIRQIYLSRFTDQNRTVTEEVPCETGCHVLNMTIGGAAASPTDMGVEYTVGPLAVDGTVRPEVLTDGGWGPTPVRGDVLQSAKTVQTVDSTLVVQLDQTDQPELTRLTSGDIPAARPVVAGRDAVNILNDVPTGNPATTSLPPTAEAAVVSESIPFVGPKGVLADHTMTVQGNALDESDWNVHILANAQTPERVHDDLAARGIILATTNTAVAERLNATAYALAIRLYGIAAGLVLLMALAGLVITTAVQLPGRRSDAASMRVIGVRRRSVLAATMRETGIVLSAAIVAGALAGLTAQLVVLRTLTLGSIADQVTSPRLLAVLDPTQVALSAAVAVVVLVAATVTSATLTVRGAKGAVLRDQGR